MVTKAIIFDCFGVLVASSLNALLNDYPEFNTQINDLGRQSYYGLITRQQFNHSLSEIIGIKTTEIDSRYWGASVMDKSAIDWVRELKKSGKYKIGMLSNVGSGFFNKFLSETEQHQLFDEVILSSDVGMAKPEVMIFELTAQRLGVKTSECIMIDDTKINIDASESAGMRAIWFISTDQAKYELSRFLDADHA
jgi:HAD superfamily hydrolase (TIGR01509 family)